MNDESDFEVLPAGEMRQKYGLAAENRAVIRLNPRNVPPALRHLIPLAEEFGISDDLVRSDFIAKAPAADIEQLNRIVQAHDADLDEWLAGPAADGPTYTDEYIAFSCMRMAADGC